MPLQSKHEVYFGNRTSFVIMSSSGRRRAPICPSVCLCVRTSVRLRVRPLTFSRLRDKVNILIRFFWNLQRLFVSLLWLILPIEKKSLLKCLVIFFRLRDKSRHFRFYPILVKLAQIVSIIVKNKSFENEERSSDMIILWENGLFNISVIFSCLRNNVDNVDIFFFFKTCTGCLYNCTCKHYENTSIQIYWKFHHRKNENFQIKNSNIFHISAQNIDCGYSLEPPRRGGSNEYPQSMFVSKIRKIMYIPVNPSSTI